MFNWLDTETCGFHGPIVLMQWWQSDKRLVPFQRTSQEGIKLHAPWSAPINDTLNVFDEWIKSQVIGFNLSFDWFHVCQMYTTLLELRKDRGNCYLGDHIEQYADCEPIARTGPCIKPVSAMDLMLHARKGPYQSMMEREDIRIRRIPRVLGQSLAEELDARIPFKDIYFAKKKNTKERWKIHDIKDDLGDIHPDLVDLVLSFDPSSALKALAQDALGYDSVDKFADVDVDEQFRPAELGYAPCARFVEEPNPWPVVIREHISHWAYNDLARNYARNDIVYTRELDRFFNYPEMGDDDSILACMVGAVRWKGFKIDVPKMQGIIDKNRAKNKLAPGNFNSPEVARRYLMQVIKPEEAAAFSKNGKIETGKIILEEIAKWKIEDVCKDCFGEGCTKCDAGTVPVIAECKCIGCQGEKCRACKGVGHLVMQVPHPAAYRAVEITLFRQANYEAELLTKFLKAGRFHASFNVIGALSSRMSGADGINAQGINRGKEIRSCFPLADDDMVCTGGDFAGFEVTLADAVYNDPDLRADLLTLRPCKKCAKGYSKTPEKYNIIPIQQMDGTIKDGPASASCDECKGTGQEGTKIHALFGQYLFPPMTYDEIYDTKGLPGALDKYSRSKNGVFALLYGGEGYTLSTRVGVPESVANEASLRWSSRYVVWGAARREIITKFCSMTQPNGIGSQVVWKDPADYVETMLGFRRYFTLENRVCKALFEIADNPPKEWLKIKIKVMRRDREQTATGALRSALFGAAFGIQAGNMRAAANHVIQGTGAGLTKKLQRRIWDLQPSGLNEWYVQPMNIHDEIITPTKPSVVHDVLKIKDSFVVEFRSMVPLMAIDWTEKMDTWADK